MIKNVILMLLLGAFFSCGKDRCNPEKLISVSIEEITVKSFPNLKPTNETWDSSFLESEFPADLAISVSSGNQLIGESMSYKPNVVSPSEEVFISPYLIEDVDLELVISIWDMDDVENELIGSVAGVPRDIYRDSDCEKEFIFIQNNVVIEILASFTEK